MFAKILFHPNIFPVLFLAAFLVNVTILKSTPLGLLLMIVYFAHYGWMLGGVVAGQEKGLIRWWIGSLVLTGIIMLIGTVFYYLIAVPKELFILIILCTPPFIGILVQRRSGPSLLERFHVGWNERRHRIPKSVFVVSALILLLCSMYLFGLSASAVTDAVRSPWERIDPSIFVLLGLALLLLFGLLARGKERALTLPIFSFVLFAFLALALLMFPIGYGFDSFIHRATEDYLAKFGTISPKPLYYIGQYVLVLFLHHGFALPIHIADAFLVPILTALWLPIAWYSAAVHITGKKRLSMLCLTGLFLVPLSSFIVTTPQSLSNLFTLLLILLSVPYLFLSERPRLWLCGLVAVCALAIHPIAGLPAMLYFALLCTDPERAPAKFRVPAKLIAASIIIISSVILPASFLVNAALSNQVLTFDLAALNPLYLLSQLNIQIFFENQFNPLLDFAYIVGRNALLLLIVIALWAGWTYRRDLSRRTHMLLWMALALTVNYLIMKSALDFTFLINYERLNYAERLVPLIGFFLAPFFLLGLSHLLINLKSRPLILRVFTLVLLCGFALSTFYLTYPRRDVYETSRAFNTSEADVSAVHLIEQWADEIPYLVLANQSVSAAAISEIGFRYFGNLFFYPIPTGEALYQSFLTMNETPTREVAESALNLVPMHGDVFTLFFVVNDYWWDSARIIETAKTTADDWRAVGGVHIFRYNLM